MIVPYRKFTIINCFSRIIPVIKRFFWKFSIVIWSQLPEKHHIFRESHTGSSPSLCSWMNGLVNVWHAWDYSQVLSVDTPRRQRSMEEVSRVPNHFQYKIQYVDFPWQSVLLFLFFWVFSWFSKQMPSYSGMNDWISQWSMKNSDVTFRIKNRSVGL